MMKVIIETLSKEGFGVGDSVEVPFTMPGDEVEAEPTKRRRGLKQSRLLQVVTPAKERIVPLCKHFGSCGGCRWQHIPYALQLAEKESRLRALFAPYLTDQVLWHPILPCHPQWNYRNKMEFTFSSDRHGTRYLGLIMQGSRGKVFQLEECHLTNRWYEKAVKVISDWWANSGLEAYHPGKNTGSLRTLIVREGERTGDRLLMLTVSGDSDYALKGHHLKTLQEAVYSQLQPSNSEATLSLFVRIQQIAKGQPTQFYEMQIAGPDHIREVLQLPETKLNVQISPSAFFQPNTKQAEQIYAAAMRLAQVSANDRVYDLYCGTGILGLCAASKAKEVVGIEISPESIIDGKENLKVNQISNMTFRQGDVGQVLEALKGEGAPQPDVVLVDPPRAGLDPKAIRHLIELNPGRLVYISCNPTTQAANLHELTAAGYVLREIQPVDQFPHTIHVENIILLTRNGT